MPLKINGSTSGSVTLAAPATGSDVTLTLPGSSGTPILDPGAWTTFTPTMSGGTWAVGNGAFSQTAYVQIGKTVIYRGYFTFGSTTVKDATTAMSISLPVTAAASWASVVGNCTLLDSGTANYFSVAMMASATTFNPMAPSTDRGQFAGITSTTPFTWATSDAIRWTITYEAA